MKIIDNFLSDVEYNQLYNIVSDLKFPWYFGKVVNESNHCQFTHCFYEYDEPSGTYHHIRFFRNKLVTELGMKALLRMKVNLNPHSETVIEHTDGWHTDFPDVRTAIFYINTNNGYTLFKTGEKVHSIKNRLVVFDSNIEHTGTSCSDEVGRLVMNINFV